jgi:dipeptidyl aminopeptidase/acylaminoacyl peptidase
MLLTGGGSDRPEEVYWWQDGRLTRLTNENAELSARLVPSRRIEVKRGGLSIPAYVVGEPRQEAGPLVLYVHGGPHGAYGESVSFAAQIMAGAGYQVLQVNPRGSAGYGAQYRDAVRGDWGGEDYEDLMAAVDRLVADGVADPDRLYVTGGSYGGFMTAWIVGSTRRFRAASTVVPVTNQISMMGTSDIGWWFITSELKMENALDWERLWRFSPLSLAEEVATPVQVVAGEDDRRCPIEQAEQYYYALKRVGVPTEFLRYPGSHTFGSQGRPDLRKDRLKRLLEWFQRFA